VRGFGIQIDGMDCRRVKKDRTDVLSSEVESPAVVLWGVSVRMCVITGGMVGEGVVACVWKGG
jgi:hypothetical protein